MTLWLSVNVTIHNMEQHTHTHTKKKRKRKKKEARKKVNNPTFYDFTSNCIHELSMLTLGKHRQKTFKTSQIHI